MSKPIVASYCATFLAPEMLHVYRQITGLQQLQQRVVTQKWINQDRFPVPEGMVRVVPKSRSRALRRFWFKQLLDGPVMVSPRQTEAILDAVKGAELLHVYFGHIGVFLLPVLRKRPLPVVVSFHGADAGVDMDKPRHREAMQEMFALADRVLVRSESLGREVEKLGCPPEKIRLSRTGIPLDDWPLVERKPPVDGKWRMLQACRLIEKKGLDLSLKALKTVREQFPGAELRIAGEGPLLETLEHQAEELGITDAVTFLGFLSQAELKAEMESAQLFLHPSRIGADGNQEGVPNSMLEAMASGMAVVATRHGGIPEVIEHETSGWLVEEEDWKGLAEGMIHLMQNPEAYSAVVKAGRQVVEGDFSREAQIRQLEAVYWELIQKN